MQVDAQAPFRRTPEDVARFHVRSGTGEMVPLSALVTSEMRGGPSIINKTNGFPSALVTGAPAPGRSTGEMYEAAERLMAASYGPVGYGYAYSGQSYQERTAGGGGGMVMVPAHLVFWSWPRSMKAGFRSPSCWGPLDCSALLGAWLRGMANVCTSRSA